MGYILKKDIPKGAVVHFPRQRKRIILEKATQKELKLLYDMKHPYIEMSK